MAKDTPELLILDESKNHLDLDSIKIIEETLDNFTGALLVVSQDDAFLKAIKIELNVSL